MPLPTTPQNYGTRTQTSFHEDAIVSTARGLKRPTLPPQVRLSFRYYFYQRYFQHLTVAKAIIYLVVVVYVISVCILVVLELFLYGVEDTHAVPPVTNTTTTAPASDLPTRPFWLLFLTREECSLGRRLLASVLLGGIIGWERRDADRPAGIRTMSLVSLGSCLFSINSVFAFRSGPMEWDASRVSAAIPSGVGFLGAGLIFKQAQQDRATGETSHVVHGLTTASSLWVSAAVGMACAGQLYFAACFSVAVMMALLRFGPRQKEPMDSDDEEDEDDDHQVRPDDSDEEPGGDKGFHRQHSGLIPPSRLSQRHKDHHSHDAAGGVSEELTPLRRDSIGQHSQQGSVRLLRNSRRRSSRASLGGIV